MAKSPSLLIHLSNSNGYSLVELMVAAVILGMSVSGVMTMIGIGREIELENRLWGQASVMASSLLEDTTFENRRYPYPDFTPSEYTVTLYKGYGQTVTAYVRAAIQSEEFEQLTPMTGSAVPDCVGSAAPECVPFKSLNVKVKWDVGGRTDSVVSQKKMYKIQ